MLKAYQVALYFLFLAREQDSGEIISNLKMQKLLYYAQGEFLAIFNKPLFSDKIEAWKYGPVVKSVYEKFKVYGRLAIDFKELENFKSEVYNKEALDFLPFFYKKYIKFSALELVEKTHNEPPYKQVYSEYITQEITQESLKEFFTQELNKRAEKWAD
ncbi:MAG: DUF4065 domain-containing protein [Helicobacteraceae bacterium]|nr:DUF4065 domain-containing protein [Helicobacteraceae bacterium]